MGYSLTDSEMHRDEALIGPGTYVYSHPNVLTSVPELGGLPHLVQRSLSLLGLLS